MENTCTQEDKHDVQNTQMALLDKLYPVPIGRRVGNLCCEQSSAAVWFFFKSIILILCSRKDLFDNENMSDAISIGCVEGQVSSGSQHKTCKQHPFQSYEDKKIEGSVMLETLIFSGTTANSIPSTAIFDPSCWNFWFPVVQSNLTRFELLSIVLVENQTSEPWAVKLLRKLHQIRFLHILIPRIFDRKYEWISGWSTRCFS